MSRILVVDDDPASADTMGLYLEAVGGHSCEMAYGAAPAKERMKKERYDVLVFDYLLRNGNGGDLLKWTRENGVTTPALIASAIDEIYLARVGEDLISRGFGPVEVIPKIPSQRDAILTAVTRATAK